ncbi:MAG: electron transfer flavoprotein subunit beta/FixA family protein [Clostridia bacterium]|nr:electron transfer flavoprotein subunit beta/FixA family protein [Clostridia bacterium]
MPPASFRIREDGRAPREEGLPRAIGPFDQNALEIALQLKDAREDVRVTALSLGPAAAQEALRKALSLNVDRALRVDLDPLPGPDSLLSARLLAEALKRLDPPADLVLVGRQSGDWDQGVVGPALAELLGWPLVGLAFAAGFDEAGRLVLTRQVEDGVERVRPGLPAVATVTNHESNVLRLPKLKDVVAAHRKPVETILAAELGVGLEPTLSVAGLAVPERGGRCEFLEGEPAEVAKELAERLRRWLSA